MGKITRDDLRFDSELEMNYYDYLVDNKINFIYHPNKTININSKNNYEPDFIEIHSDVIYITETKGYNPYSKLKDEMIHNTMIDKPISELNRYITSLGIEVGTKEVIYRKIKYLKTYGFVDFNFKNPNSLLNTRRNKIKELELENKDLKEQVKNLTRYFNYMHKDKLTKKQNEWLVHFVSSFNS